jgi:Fe-S-cluster containining protein
VDDDRDRRLRAHLELIEAGVAPVVARYREHIACRPGCADCCHQSFRVAEIEGGLLRQGLAAADESTRHDIQARARAYRADARMPCPVLSTDGRCRLYEHRPRICRKYGIPLWHPDRPHEVKTCHLNFRHVHDLEPELILDPQAGWARDWIALRRELGLGPSRTQTIAQALLDAPLEPGAGDPEP